MAFEQKDGNGSMFKSTTKKQDNHADYTGSCKIDGKNYWVNGWIKKKGELEYYSLSFKPMNVKTQPADIMPDDEIPL